MALRLSQGTKNCERSSCMRTQTKAEADSAVQTQRHRNSNRPLHHGGYSGMVLRRQRRVLMRNINKRTAVLAGPTRIRRIFDGCAVCIGKSGRVSGRSCRNTTCLERNYTMR